MERHRRVDTAAALDQTPWTVNTALNTTHITHFANCCKFSGLRACKVWCPAGIVAGSWLAPSSTTVVLKSISPERITRIRWEARTGCPIGSTNAAHNDDVQVPHLDELIPRTPGDMVRVKSGGSFTSEIFHDGHCLEHLKTLVLFV